MSGVFKDILLVVASMVIFGDPVTLQQYFGYSIALAGLVYYKLGAEKSFISDRAFRTKLATRAIWKFHEFKFQIMQNLTVEAHKSRFSTRQS